MNFDYLQLTFQKCLPLLLMFLVSCLCYIQGKKYFLNGNFTNRRNVCILVENRSSYKINTILRDFFSQLVFTVAIISVILS